MNCPTCGYASEAQNGEPSEDKCPKCQERHSRLRFARNNFVKVHTVSGRAIEFSRIKFYDLVLYQQIEQLRHSATANLAGYSTGVGYWGDMESVALASVVTGIIESSVSGNMRAKGMNQLSDVAGLANQLRKTAEFVDVTSIKNIEHPDPSIWHAVSYRNNARRELIHIPSNCLWIEANGKELMLFLDKIEQYELIKKY